MKKQLPSIFLFLLASFCLPSMVHAAGWKNILSEEVRKSVCKSFVNQCAKDFPIFAKELQGPMLQEIIKIRKKGLKEGDEGFRTFKISLSNKIYKALVYELRRVEDKNYVISSIKRGEGLAIDFNKEPGNYTLSVVRSTKDGLVNKIIRDLVIEKQNEYDWNEKKCKAAFDMLWDTFVRNGKISGLDELYNTLDSKNLIHLSEFLKSDGHNLIVKLSNYLADLISNEFEKQETELDAVGACGCFGSLGNWFTPECLKKCGDSGKAVAKHVPEFITITLAIVKVVAMVAVVAG